MEVGNITKAATFKSYKNTQIRINYVEEISIKSDAKKMKDYQILKIIIALYYCKLSTNSLAMNNNFRYLIKIHYYFFCDSAFKNFHETNIDQ